MPPGPEECAAEDAAARGESLRQEALHWSCGCIEIEVMVVLGCVLAPPVKLQWISPRETIGWVKEIIEARTKSACNRGFSCM